jgi:hypothetical protein
VLCIAWETGKGNENRKEFHKKNNEKRKVNRVDRGHSNRFTAGLY